MALRRKTAVTVAIGGGKGGVGKSVVASNLAISVARLGARVVLVDADLGAANQHTLFGIDRPGVTLQALVEGRIATLEEAVVPTRIPRVSLVPGSGAVVGAANIGHARKMKLIRHIQSLDADVVIVDCGAGSGFDVVDLYDMADLRLVVVAPQLTSMQNAYGFLKSALFRSLRKVAINQRERDMIDEACQGGETEQVSDVVRRVRRRDAVLADALQSCVGAFQASLIGNMLDHEGQRRAIASLSKMFRDFLGLEVPLIASLPRSSDVHRSVTQRRPYLSDHTTGVMSHEMMAVAEKVLVADVHAIRSARRRTPVDEEGRLPGPLANYIRTHDRFRVDLACRLMKDDGEFAGGRIIDASPTGMRIDCEFAPELGDEICVTVGDCSASTVVRRVAEGELGVEWQGAGTALLAHLESQELRLATA